MLSQRIAKNTLRIVSTSAKTNFTIEKIKTDLLVFKDTHNKLTKINIPELKYIYFGQSNSLDTLALNFIDSCEKIISGDYSQQTIEKISDYSDGDFLQQLDNVVKALELYSTKQNNIIKNAETIILIFTLLILILEAIFIFYPIEKSLEDYIRKLENKNQELKMISFSFSHHMQEPLRRLALTSERIKMALPVNKLEDLNIQANKLSSTTHRISKLIKDLRDYISWDNLNEAPTNVQTQILLENILAELKEEFPQKIFKVNYNGNFPQVQAKLTHFKEIFVQILRNSFLHSNNNDLNISITHKSYDKGQSFIIEDNSVGIDLATLNKVFNLFSTALPSDQALGSGLGLALVKKLIDKLGYSIIIESILDKGTKIELKIPK